MRASVTRLRHRGAAITVKRLPGFDHVGSWIQAMPRAVRYFAGQVPADGRAP